jgi:hypothetical protein
MRRKFGRMQKNFIALATLFLMMMVSSQSLRASTFAFGINGGMKFPFWHTERMDPGVSLDANWRVDPYELRFSYSYIDVHYYSVLLGVKHFFSSDTLRPYVEIAGGPLIVNTKAEGLAYGISPVGSLGVELGINENFSSLAVARYSGFFYFGDTKSGSWEANHALSILAGVTLWF